MEFMLLRIIMNILIIENDTYLSQSISNQLIDKGYDCFISRDIKARCNENTFFDVVLASYDVCSDYSDLLRRYSNSIVIMMIKYISDNTVTKLMKSGVSDYILKPFSVEELVRKIGHYKDFNTIKKEVVFYKNYFEFIETILDIPMPNTFNPPFIIRASTQRSADIYAMRYARLKNIHFDFLSLNKLDWKDVLKLSGSPKSPIYITGLESLRNNDRLAFLSNLSRQNMVLSFVSKDEISFKNVVNITNNENSPDLNSEILSVKDYEKMVILKYESMYSDVELAKKLGMSRKSLWEKRKKYDIIKKKKL